MARFSSRSRRRRWRRRSLPHFLTNTRLVDDSLFRVAVSLGADFWRDAHLDSKRRMRRFQLPPRIECSLACSEQLDFISSFAMSCQHPQLSVESKETCAPFHSMHPSTKSATLSCISVTIVLATVLIQFEKLREKSDTATPRALKWSARHRMWTLSENHDNYEKNQSSCLWPEECPANDRIVEQLLVRQPRKSSKLIKIATWPSSLVDSPGQGYFEEQDCRVNKCSITTNLDEADAIVFQNADVRVEITKNRRAGQVWIAYLLESPPNTFDMKFNRAYRGMHEFNWTATYRSDSDIVTPYAKFLPYENSLAEYLELNAEPIDQRYLDLNYKRLASDEHRDLINQKQGRVAWFVSNCHARNARLEVARELAKFIPVDIYGRCGDLQCDKHNQTGCLNMINKQYKFYLAFENSNNSQYITEKLYRNAYNYNDPNHLMLPVVMGPRREDYDKLVPRRSFIHLDDFESIESLAKYLHLLDSNDTLYYSYFYWKRMGNFIDTKFMCRVCAMLHTAVAKRRIKTYPDVKSWWRRE